MTKEQECLSHGWQKYHPNEECLICYYVDLKEQVLTKYPHYEDNDRKLEDGMERLHTGRTL